MTLENIALWAQRKGIDLLGTGDCLQPQWLEEIEAHTVEAEPGLRKLKPDIEMSLHARLPEGLRRSLRFILSTEVNCVPRETADIEGLHQLLYFPSVVVAREFAARLAKRGDLREGRPTVGISAQQLLRGVDDFERVYLAPAHVMNPWFSALGVVGGELSLDQVYGDQLPQLLAVETGLTSDPTMCRRIPGMDRFGLFSCSDAHSLESLGRECTLLDVEPSYDAVMAALRAGTNDCLRGTIKFPLRLTRYYLNWCSRCKTPFDAALCPQCGRELTVGSRDRLATLKDVRSEAAWPKNRPPSEALAPLVYVIAEVERKKPDSLAVKRAANEIVEQLGRHERYILTEASAEELMRVARPEIAGAIIGQRTGEISHRGEFDDGRLGQGAFGF